MLLSHLWFLLSRGTCRGSNVHREGTAGKGPLRLFIFCFSNGKPQFPLGHRSIQGQLVSQATGGAALASGNSVGTRGVTPAPQGRSHEEDRNHTSYFNKGNLTLGVSAACPRGPGSYYRKQPPLLGLHQVFVVPRPGAAAARGILLAMQILTESETLKQPAF